MIGVTVFQPINEINTNLINDDYFKPIDYYIPSIPKDFYEQIIHRENQLMIDKNLQNLEEVMELYKKGAEYYSDEKLQKAFKSKMQDILSDKQNIKIFDKGSKARKNSIHSSNSQSSRSSIPKDRSNFILFKSLNKSFAKNSNKNKNSFIALNTRVFTEKDEKFNEEIRKFNEINYDSTISDLIGKLDTNSNNAISLIEKDLASQVYTFQCKLRKKQTNISLSFNTSINYINKEQNFSMDSDLETDFNSFNNNLKQLTSQPLQNSTFLLKIKKSFPTVFDEYFEKIENTFQSKIEFLSQYFMKEIHTSYQKKIDIYLKSQEKIIDNELLKKELDHNYTKAIDVVIKKHISERERLIDKINHSTNEKIRLMVKLYSGSLDGIKEINENFLLHIVNFIKY